MANYSQAHRNPALMDACDDRQAAWLDGLSHKDYGELLRAEAELHKNADLHELILRATRDAYELATGSRE